MKRDRDRAWQLLAGLVTEGLGDWRRNVSEATGLPFSRFRALRRLADEPLTLKELAESMQTDAPAATVLVNALEAAGLVVREVNPDDRRVKVVWLTPAGKKVVAAGKAVNDAAPPMFEALDDADVAALTRILSRLRDAD